MVCSCTVSNSRKVIQRFRAMNYGSVWYVIILRSYHPPSASLSHDMTETKVCNWYHTLQLSLVQSPLSMTNSSAASPRYSLASNKLFPAHDIHKLHMKPMTMIFDGQYPGGSDERKWSSSYPFLHYTPLIFYLNFRPIGCFLWNIYVISVTYIRFWLEVHDCTSTYASPSTPKETCERLYKQLHYWDIRFPICRNLGNCHFDLTVFIKLVYSKPSSNDGDMFLESVAFRKSALDELNTAWD